MAKGFGGMPGNLQGMLNQAKRLQKEIQKAQEEAEKIVLEGSAGGGMVKVEITGAFELKSVVLEKEVVNPDDIEMLQDLVMAAINDGLRKIKQAKEEIHNKATGGLGMDIPGLF